LEENLLLNKINDVINEKIRPSLEMDGGDIQVLELKEKNLYVQLHGACAHCPHATETLKNGVERVLQTYVDLDIVVVAD
jgi:Fe-S cluster biogenesis protein NfuA